MRRIFILIIFLPISGCFVFKNINHNLNGKLKHGSFKIYFSEAQKYFLLQQYDYAEKLAINALKYKPNSAATYYLLARIYSNLDTLPLAIEYAQKATENNPKNLWYWRLLATLYQKQNNINDAIKIYKQKIIDSSTVIADYYNLLNLYITVGRTSSAINLLKDIRQKEGFTIDNFNIALNLYSQVLDTNAIMQEYKKAVYSYPTNMDILYSLANFVCISNRYDFADEIADSLAHWNYYSGYYYFLKSYYFLNLDSIKLFFVNFKKAVYSYDIDKMRLYHLFQTIKYSLNYDTMGNYFDSLFVLVKDAFLDLPEFYSFFADEYIEHHQFYKAKNSLEYAFHNNIISSENASVLGWLYIRLNMIDTLKYFLDTISVYYPMNLRLYYYKSIYYLKKRKPDIALKAIANGEKYNVSNFQMKAFFLYLKYLAYAYKKDNQNADSYFSKAMSLFQRDCSTLAYLVYLNVYLNIDINRIKQFVDSCLSDTSRIKSADDYFIFAYYFYSIKKFSNAKNLILKAIELNNSDFIYYELAYHIFEAIGDSKNADFYKKKALILGSKLSIFKV